MPPGGVDPCKGDNDLTYVNNANAWSMLPGYRYHPPPLQAYPGNVHFFLLFPGSLFPTPGHAKGKDIIPHPRAPNRSHLRYFKYIFLRAKLISIQY